MDPSSSSTGRLSAVNWIRAALAVIAEGGLDAVAVEPMARRLGVTKGSFYWHFPTRAALIDAALAAWEQTGTEQIIALLEAEPDPRTRLRHLLFKAIGDRDGGRLVAALYAAADDPQVAPVLQRVTDRRLRYLQDAYAQLGLGGDEARRWALHAYATYMGIHHLLRTGLADTELADFAAELTDILIPEAGRLAPAPDPKHGRSQRGDGPLPRTG